MASSTQHCAINDCKRPCRALCLCCDQYLCRDHLNEHDTLINAQIPLLMDQINSLSDQFNHDDGSEFAFLKDLEQWRENAHRAVDQFYEKNLQQCQQIIEIKRNKQKKEFDQMKLNFNELVQQQDATKQQIDSMKQSIQFFEQSIKELPYFHLNINPLAIDDNLIILPTENHQNTSFTFPNKRSSHTEDRSTRWEVEQQSRGITDSMKINILNTMSVLIDTHGPSSIGNLIKDMQNWLNESFGKHWIVQIIDQRQKHSSQTIYPIESLQVKETRLRWTIGIFKHKG
ncbi:unnamed protein product [Adineta ricciae]|uniref:Uncharacterized protein n=1 Tax=Adineta ricciae TaxID=249248 RepID=A0A814QAL2_ADIRI|nr:unnamed protein product [Adineta ricciae]CAF1454793.1 unnamed protein product [Adineta ricciae]